MPKNNKLSLRAGDIFNRLTVVDFSHADKRWRKFYNTKCECGNKKVVMGSAMASGNTKSCGCLAVEARLNKRISKNHSEVTAIILGYKRHAEDRGFKWSLSRDDVINLISKNCTYCSAPPSNKKKTKNSIGDGLSYSGIDRVDSNLDYTEFNTTPCCKVCNYAKSNMEIDEFRLWAIRIGKKAMAEQWAGPVNDRVNGFYWANDTDTTGTYRSIYEYYNGDWYSCGRKIKPRNITNINEMAIAEVVITQK